MRDELRGRKKGIARICFSDPGADAAANRATQVECPGGYMRMARHISRQQDLSTRVEQILTDLASFPALEAVSRGDQIAANAGLLAEMQGKTRFAVVKKSSVVSNSA